MRRTLTIIGLTVVVALTAAGLTSCGPPTNTAFVATYWIEGSPVPNEGYVARDVCFRSSHPDFPERGSVNYLILFPGSSWVQGNFGQQANQQITWQYIVSLNYNFTYRVFNSVSGVTLFQKTYIIIPIDVPEINDLVRNPGRGVGNCPGANIIPYPGDLTLTQVA